MRYPQLLVYESDGLLAGMLRPLAEERKWVLREPRQTAACLRLLRRAHPAVLVIKVGTDSAGEMNLLERVRWLRPEAFTVVVLEPANPAVAALAWHAGATYVVAPPQPRTTLPELISSLMENAIERSRPKSGQTSQPPLEKSAATPSEAAQS